jgi:cyclohexanone monooxygenase
MTQAEPDYDVIVIGAGFGGLYALYKLRSEGFAVRVLEVAPSVGGTWFWNGYPGARCDVESADYSYTFSPELDQEWVWSERYAAQPEILRYLNYVADRFSLREDIQLNTFVSSARYDEELRHWILESEAGEVLSAKYCVFATGQLSAPMKPKFQGAERFRGETFMTSLWPRSGVDFAGKRVAVIGTGSSGVQAVPVIADEADHVFVFQRTPQYILPGRNHPLTEVEMAEIKAGYPERRTRQRRSHTGLSVEVNPTPALELTPDEQERELERRWNEGGALALTVTFGDVLTNVASNRLVAEFIAEQTRKRIREPQLADILAPGGYPFAARRPCADHGYYETFVAGKASIVDVSDNPISEITKDAIVLADGAVHPADAIVYAIGYDAITGALTRIDVTGRGGTSLRDVWSVEPVTYLGTCVSGFPNMFVIGGPGSPLTMQVASAECQVEWIARLLVSMRSRDIAEIEPTSDAQTTWTEHVQELSERSVYAMEKGTYYYGANVPGKPRKFSLYLGGLGRYRKNCDEIAADDYRGFVLRSAQDASETCAAERLGAE